MSGVENFYISQLQNPDKNPFGTLQILIPEIRSDIGALLYKDMGNATTYTFAIADSLSVSMSANWSPDASMDSMQNELDKKQTQLAGMAGGAGSILSWLGLESLGAGVQNLAGKRLKPLKTSYVAWQKSDTSPFSFKLSRIALTPDEDTVKPFRDLAKMVLPAYFSAGIVTTPGMYNPPYGENLWEDIKDFFSKLGDIFKGESTSKFKDDEFVKGTITIKYGTWAVIRNLLITNLSFTPSKVCTKYGLPLYTTGKIDLIPYRMLLADDIQNMFNRGEWQHYKIDDDNSLANTYGTNDIPPELFRGKKNQSA